MSVLMSVHNEPSEFIDVAVNSIINQTYNNIEFVIIDDASNDDTQQYLKKLAAKHKNIRLHINENNIGLTASLNKGLALAHGEYIARMDADDYSLPQRIEQQVEFLNNHPEINIVGTGVVSFGEKVMFMSPMDGFTSTEVQTNLFFMSSLCHPSVMFRGSFLKQTGLKYDERVKKGQDYDLWERASIYGGLAVIKKVLLYYRLHSKQITSTNRSDQDRTAEMIMRRRINRLGICPSEAEMQAHLTLKSQSASSNLKSIVQWIDKLVKASNNDPHIESKNLADDLYRRYAIIKLRSHKMPNLRDLRFLVSTMFSRLKMTYLLYRFANVIDKELSL